MFKFAMTAGLMLASFAGISSAGQMNQPVVPTQTAEAMSEYGTITVDGPFSSRAAAIVYGRTCLNLGAKEYLAEEHDDGWYVAVRW